MENKVMNLQDMNKLALSLEVSKDVITKDYLYKLSKTINHKCIRIQINK